MVHSIINLLRHKTDFMVQHNSIFDTHGDHTDEQNHVNINLNILTVRTKIVRKWIKRNEISKKYELTFENLTKNLCPLIRKRREYTFIEKDNRRWGEGFESRHNGCCLRRRAAGRIINCPSEAYVQDSAVAILNKSHNSIVVNNY